LNFLTGEIVGILLFFIGLYGLMTKKRIIKTIMSMSIMEAGVFLFFITINYNSDAIPPIGEPNGVAFSDPVPSALMITAIVIGIGVTAIGLTMFIHYKQKHGITHWSRMHNQQEDEE
jgi:multicomponent Na+:H+ antiporter subunit C